MRILTTVSVWVALEMHKKLLTVRYLHLEAAALAPDVYLREETTVNLTQLSVATLISKLSVTTGGKTAILTASL